MACLLSVSGTARRLLLSRPCLRSLPLGVLFVGLSGVAACKNQAPPAAEATAAEPPPPAPVAASAATPAPPPATAAAGTAAASKYSEAPFDVEIQAKGAYAASQPGTAEIVITAKPPFHANEKYPYKFKLNEAPGLKFANLVVDKDAVKVEKTRATLSVPFTPEGAGKHTVSGKLFFSVCNDDQCLVEKRDLALVVDAK
jgi:hypothetical protein